MRATVNVFVAVLAIAGSWVSVLAADSALQQSSAKLRTLPTIASVTDDGHKVTVIIEDDAWYNSPSSQQLALAIRLLDVLWGYGNPDRTLVIRDEKRQLVAMQECEDLPVGVGCEATNKMRIVCSTRSCDP